ncbi:uncharacterized protein DSM5745_07355 [Aspergillus mulundensis]|uniref:Uncharacterized protein n=1 Tax=Aspergillus mulundensis TaxID=1810919 RepID=A0A3D8RKY4_9EURO|nr:Uncharacterized protein DSM5745_07355 [Aspergillus mulundensis]RDW74693.1 Uncharacterized protein DSM5745_07355 [Aspergillus mulundensis]
MGAATTQLVKSPTGSPSWKFDVPLLSALSPFVRSILLSPPPSDSYCLSIMTELSPRPSRSMAIDSLLNPQGEADSAGSLSASKLDYATAPAPLTPQYSPLYPQSPTYYYSQTHHHHHHHHYNPGPRDPYASYHSYSATSSPEPHTRDRYSSVSSSTSSTNGHHSQHPHSASSSGRGRDSRRRLPRPKYEEEEMYFIWYHRVDLSQEWKEVRESFNRQFSNRKREGFQGIQCKFYRFIKEKNCPTLREQRRMRDGEFISGQTPHALSQPPADSGSGYGGKPQFGVVEWMGVWYPWMREDREEVLRKRLPR